MKAALRWETEPPALTAPEEATPMCERAEVAVAAALQHKKKRPV